MLKRSLKASGAVVFSEVLSQYIAEVILKYSLIASEGLNENFIMIATVPSLYPKNWNPFNKESRFVLLNFTSLHKSPPELYTLSQSPFVWEKTALTPG